MGGILATDAELEQSLRENVEADPTKEENDKFFFLLWRLCRIRNCSTILKSVLNLNFIYLILIISFIFRISWKLHPRIKRSHSQIKILNIIGLTQTFVFFLKHFYDSYKYIIGKTIFLNASRFVFFLFLMSSTALALTEFR